MEALFKATFPLESHISKKNSRPIFQHRSTGKPFLGKSARLRGAEDILVCTLRSIASSNRLFNPITSNLLVRITFGFSQNQFYTLDRKTGELRQKKNLPDLSNLVEIVTDSLQSARVIVNDSQIQHLECSRVCTEKTQLTVELYGVKNDQA